MNVQIEEITPELAIEMLNCSAKNFRSIDNKRVAKYSRDMKEGTWELNGSTIVIGRDNTLLDGQHRLKAVAHSGASIKFVVVRDAISDGLSIDRGKPRTIGQWLLYHEVKNGNGIAATSRLCVAYDIGIWERSTFQNAQITDRQIVEYAESHKANLQSAYKLASKAKGLMPLSSIAAIIHNGSPGGIVGDLAEWFVHSLSRGTDLASHEPVLLLRNRLILSQVRQNLTPYAKRMLATIAWNKTVLDTPCRSLRFQQTGPSKTIPPNVILVANQQRSAKRGE